MSYTSTRDVLEAVRTFLDAPGLLTEGDTDVLEGLGAAILVATKDDWSISPRAAEYVETMRGPEVCDCCAGTGKPVSGGDCICGGKGTALAERQGLREAVATLRVELDRAVTLLNGAVVSMHRHRRLVG